MVKRLFFDRVEDDMAEHLKDQYTDSGQIEFVIQDLMK